jgi:hypothetical protein
MICCEVRREGARLGADEATLARLPKPGEPIFYPKVGHCVFRGVIEDRAVPGARMVELEDTEEGSRILVPLSRVPALNLRPAGLAMEAIQQELSSQFEEAIPEDADRHRVIEELITDGSPRSLARARPRAWLARKNRRGRRSAAGWRQRWRSPKSARVPKPRPS